MDLAWTEVRGWTESHSCTSLTGQRYHISDFVTLTSSSTSPCSPLIHRHNVEMPSFPSLIFMVEKGIISSISLPCFHPFIRVQPHVTQLLPHVKRFVNLLCYIRQTHCHHSLVKPGPDPSRDPRLSPTIDVRVALAGQQQSIYPHAAVAALLVGQRSSSQSDLLWMHLVVK